MALKRKFSSYHGRLPTSRPYQFYQGHLGRKTGLLSTRFLFSWWRTRIRNQWITLVITNISSFNILAYWSKPIRKNYNGGQKSWDTFTFLWRFQIRRSPTPALTPQTKLEGCIQNFSRDSTLYRVGEGRTARQLRKWCTVLWKHPESINYYEYSIIVPRTFLQDCRAYNTNQGKYSTNYN